jgi:methylated-DNA-[protein]-cysteine S-methyltransferase
MTHFYDTFSTPVGEFSVAVDADGRVVATAFGGLEALRGRFDPQKLVHDPARLHAVRREVREFFAGQREQFSLKLAPVGTPFQQGVWAALGRIPFGETRSYGQLADELGRPGAARAVGRANATNPIALFTPCHRVIGRDGSLTGFAFGEEIKRQLLAHEQASRPALV